MSPAPIPGRALVACLYDGLEGVLDLRAILRGGAKPPVQQFCAPDDSAAIGAFIQHYRERDAYFGVALRRDTTSGTLRNCSALPALFCDLDFKDFPEGEVGARSALSRSLLLPTAVVRSGGGLHVYFKLAEPLDLHVDAAVAGVLQRRLAVGLDGDPRSTDVAHVLRLPGGWNHKYDPPRPVVLECLEPGRVFQPSDFDDWLPVAPVETVGAPRMEATISTGERNNQLTSLAGSMRRRGASPEAIYAALKVENTARCRPPLAEAEVHAIAASVGRYTPDVAELKTAEPHRTVRLTPASAIQIRPVRWLWEERLALGTLALMGGREGVGKTTCAYTLTADLTRGRLRGVYSGTPRGVIIAATEDSWEHTIVPRLLAADADLSLVFRVEVETAEGVETSLVLPRDLPALERLVAENNAALIILDPLLSRLDSKLDTHKDAEVRLALEPLVKLAGATDATVLGLIHVSKSATSDPLTMLMGSRAFAAVARAVLFVMTDPDDEQRRLLGQPKNNLGRTDLSTLAFRIVGAQVAEVAEGRVWTGRLEWLGESDRSIKDAIDAATESAGDKTATQEATDWLSDYLTSQGGMVDSKLIKDAGKTAGHSVPSLQRARLRLQLAAESRGFPRKTYWSFRQSSQRSGEIGTTETTETTDAKRGVQSPQSSQSFQSSQSPRKAVPPSFLIFGDNQ